MIPALGRLAYTEIPVDLIRSSLAKEDPLEDLPDLGIYGQFVMSRKLVKNES